MSFTSIASAQYSSPNQGFLRIGSGLLSFASFKNTKNEAADTDLLGTSYVAPLNIQARIGEKLVWGPRFLFTPLSVQAPDKGSSSTILLGSLPLIHNLNEDTTLSIGLGYMLRRIKGKGGTLDLNNGTSTATFALPGRTVTSKNFFLELGGSKELGRASLQLDILTTNILDSSRAVTLLLLLNIKM